MMVYFEINKMCLFKDLRFKSVDTVIELTYSEIEAIGSSLISLAPQSL